MTIETVVVVTLILLLLLPATIIISSLVLTTIMVKTLVFKLIIMLALPATTYILFMYSTYKASTASLLALFSFSYQYDHENFTKLLQGSHQIYTKNINSMTSSLCRSSTPLLPIVVLYLLLLIVLYLLQL